MADHFSNNTSDPDILDPEDIVVTIDLEDGSSIDCEILTIFSVGPQDYIALLPTDEQNQIVESKGVYLYRYFEDEQENYSIGNIDSDEELERVIQAFHRLADGEG
ncbi:hypothetical protein CXIVA_22180 [Clostridium sp. SY8519]|uniref:DUF1292 domain-containing protein n=1 Tax=Clostridium sp. (strain SY8519) TaxID=1042156 RepID=UPI0002171E4B|nr:DUF1292 domain-containing protein [Clostridium sp. SY8519]BAK48185.1 hypothetical protein CXIVA_22180 [Clostridium sp. SY8519]